MPVSVGTGAFENNEPDEVVLKRATVSVTVLLVKEARHLERLRPATSRAIPLDMKSISFPKVLLRVNK